MRNLVLIFFSNLVVVLDGLVRCCLEFGPVQGQADEETSARWLRTTFVQVIRRLFYEPGVGGQFVNGARFRHYVYYRLGSWRKLSCRTNRLAAAVRYCLDCVRCVWWIPAVTYLTTFVLSHLDNWAFVQSYSLDWTAPALVFVRCLRGVFSIPFVFSYGAGPWKQIFNIYSVNAARSVCSVIEFIQHSLTFLVSSSDLCKTARGAIYCWLSFFCVRRAHHHCGAGVLQYNNYLTIYCRVISTSFCSLFFLSRYYSHHYVCCELGLWWVPGAATIIRV